MVGFIVVVVFYAAFLGLAIVLQKTGIVSDPSFSLIAAFFIFAIGMVVAAFINGRVKKRRDEIKIRAAKNQLIEQFADRDIAE